MKKLFIEKRHCERVMANALTRSPSDRSIRAGNLVFWRSLRPIHMPWQVLAMTIFLFVFTSCGKPLPTLEGIDLKQWKDDKNGCNHFREKLIDTLTSQKDKLKGLSEDDVIALLGRPDQNELYKRNQKFFYYFVEASAKCEPSAETAKKLSVRFTAMGIAKEAVIE